MRRNAMDGKGTSDQTGAVAEAARDLSYSFARSNNASALRYLRSALAFALREIDGQLAAIQERKG